MTECLYHKYICDVLLILGERIPRENSFIGPKTDKVIKIMFGIDFPPATILHPVLNSWNACPKFRIFTVDHRVEQKSFSNSKETREITKKIQHALFKTELERLMYPHPELTFS